VCHFPAVDPISASHNPDFRPASPNLRDSYAQLPTLNRSGVASKSLRTPPGIEAKPIQDRPASCSLVHRAVYSVFAAMKIILLPAPRRHETEQTFFS
jgi:hypothetical protein